MQEPRNVVSHGSTPAGWLEKAAAVCRSPRRGALLVLCFAFFAASTFAQQPAAVLNPTQPVASTTAVAPPAEPPPRQPWWERAKEPLHPDVEKALADYAARIVPVRRKDLSEHMTAMIAKLVEMTKLADDAKKKALEDAAEKAVDETMKPFAKSVMETNRVRLVMEPQPKKELTKEEAAALAAGIQRWAFEALATNRLVLGCTLPEDQPLWSAALKAQLSNEQLALWDKHMAALRETKTKEIKEMLDPWEKFARGVAETSVKRKIEQMAKDLKLDEARTKKLQAAAAATIDRICKDERARAEEALSFVTDKRRAESLRRSKVFDGIKLDADPQRDRQWLDAMKSIVPQEELAALAKKKADARAKLEKDWMEFLKPSQAAFTLQAKKAMDEATETLLTAIGLPQERTKDFALAKKGALERVEKMWMKSARKALEGEDEESIRLRMESFKKSKRTYYIGFDDDEKVLQNDPVWKEDTMKVLTPEERKSYETAKADRKTRRVRAMGLVFVAELDKKVAFTAAQREKMLPIAERVVGGQTILFPTDNENSRYGRDYEQQYFFTAAKEIKEDELKPILDAKQLANWKNAMESGPERSRSRGMVIINGVVQGQKEEKKPEPPKGPQRRPEPEAVEHAISDYLHKKTMTERKRVLTGMLLKAEDAGRVAALPAKAIARLETAARGATEGVMYDMKPNWDRNVRDYTRGATAQNIVTRLAGANDYYYYNDRDNMADKQPIWTNTVKTELNAEQQAAWKTETDARMVFAERAMVAAVLAEFDRRYSINVAQWGKLEPVVTKNVTEYRVDIENYFSNSTPWHLQSYSTLIPVAGVPEKDMKTLLSKEQWNRWAEAYGDTLSYWTNVKENHDRRVKK